MLGGAKKIFSPIKREAQQKSLGTSGLITALSNQNWSQFSKHMVKSLLVFLKKGTKWSKVQESFFF